MRKWQDLGPQDDPNSWSDVDGMYPTRYGSYSRVHFGDASTLTATGAGNVLYAFAAKTLTSTVEWVVDSSKIWLQGSGLTDRTNGVTIGTYPMMAQYGNVTVCVMGSANATVISTSGGNFSALAGAPKGEIVVTCANAVLIFNTDTSADGWAASDVGDYTNWTTGEAASGRLIATPGPITSAVSFGEYVIVFKASSIYRMRYVGGTVKWASEVLHQTIGCSVNGSGFSSFPEIKYAAAASPDGVLFLGHSRPLGTYLGDFYWLTSGGGLELVNPITSVSSATSGPQVFIRYCKDEDVFSLYSYLENKVWFYCPSVGAWGQSLTPNAAAGVARPVTGGPTGLSGSRVQMPTAYYKSAANVITKYTPNQFSSGQTCYLQSTKYGRVDGKTHFNRLIPIVRKKGLLTGSATLTFDLFTELDDTVASTSRSISQSTNRRRFDLAGGVCEDTFGRFKVTWTDRDLDVDDYLVLSRFKPGAE